MIFNSCSIKQNNIELASIENTTQGLNIFIISQEQGIIKGAYIEDEYQIFFESIRGERRPFLSIIMDPTLGYSLRELFTNPQIMLYDVSACYISKEGDPFIVQDSCSIPPLCNSDDNCEINDETRAKEFELAQKAAQELQNISFPKSLQRNKESLISIVNIKDLINSSHAS